MKIKSTLVFLCFFGVFLSAREYHEILKSKTLKVGIRVREGVLDSEMKAGFHHDLIQFFAVENNNLTVELVIKESLNDYFTGNIFNDCDIVVDNLTATPKRRKYMDFVQVIPGKEVLVTLPDASVIKKLFTLRKEKIIVSKSSSYFETIKSIENNSLYKGKYQYYFSASPADQLKDLESGKGTVTILDANLALFYVKDKKQLVHATISDEQVIGWGIPKEAKIFSQKLNKFINDSKASGLFQKVWKKYYQITYDDYLYIIQTDDQAKSELRETESERLERKEFEKNLAESEKQRLENEENQREAEMESAEEKKTEETTTTEE